MGTEQETKQRTGQQNKALHVLFELLANTLNEAGYDMKRTLKAEVDIPWNGNTVKEYLWRPVQKAQLLKESTKDLTTKEIDLVFNTLNRHLGETLGVHTAFPSIEDVMEFQPVRKVQS
ncbi:MAG: hypothetical protein JWR59_2514 [Brevundimonas sp.]|nr:hypothetical protein [Brevundimonas sp.]